MKTALNQTYDPINIASIPWRYTESGTNLQQMLPLFYNDLENIIPNVNVANRIVAAIIKCVMLGEYKFTQQFGGWTPLSNEFGLTPLRPCHIHRTTDRWIWTSGSTSSLFWSAEDVFVGPFTFSDKCVLLIYGYFNLEPIMNTLEIFIQPGSTKFPVWSLVPMRLSKQKYMCFPSPIVIEPNSQLTIKASCLNTSTPEESGLLGYYFAPLAILITEKITT